MSKEYDDWKYWQEHACWPDGSHVFPVWAQRLLGRDWDLEAQESWHKVEQHALQSRIDELEAVPSNLLSRVEDWLCIDTRNRCFIVEANFRGLDEHRSFSVVFGSHLRVDAIGGDGNTIFEAAENAIGKVEAAAQETQT